MFPAEQVEESVTYNLNSSTNAKQLLSENNHSSVCLQSEVWCFAVRRPEGALWGSIPRNTSCCAASPVFLRRKQPATVLASLSAALTPARRSGRSQKWRKRRKRGNWEEGVEEQEEKQRD